MLHHDFSDVYKWQRKQIRIIRLKNKIKANEPNEKYEFV